MYQFTRIPNWYFTSIFWKWYMEILITMQSKPLQLFWKFSDSKQNLTFMYILHFTELIVCAQCNNACHGECVADSFIQDSLILLWRAEEGTDHLVPVLVTLQDVIWCHWHLRRGDPHSSWIHHTQNTPSAPGNPIQHPIAGERTPMTPMGLVMAGCWQINSILTNIGRRNSIRILNQYPFFWNILIWTQFICFINLFAFWKLKLL